VIDLTHQRAWPIYEEAEQRDSITVSPATARVNDSEMLEACAPDLPIQVPIFIPSGKGW
jgi:hypothetical protein